MKRVAAKRGVDGIDLVLHDLDRVVVARAEVVELAQRPERIEEIGKQASRPAAQERNRRGVRVVVLVGTVLADRAAQTTDRFAGIAQPLRHACA